MSKHECSGRVVRAVLALIACATVSPLAAEEFDVVAPSELSTYSMEHSTGEMVPYRAETAWPGPARLHMPEHYVEPLRPTRHVRLIEGASDPGYRLPLSLSRLGSANKLYAGAWIDQGMTINPDRPLDRFNGPVTYNDRSNEYQFNQLYLTLARKPRVEEDQWDWGGQADVLYGSDYLFTTATGLETHSDGTPKWNSDGPRSQGGAPAALYGMSLPQAFLEAFVPLGRGLDVRVGRFYSNIGFESVRSPQNFFYSHSYMFQYGQPRTFTGVKATYDLNPNVLGSVGYARGWDAWGADRDDTWTTFLQVMWTSNSGRLELGSSFVWGSEETLLGGLESRRLNSLIMNLRLDGKSMFVLQGDYGVHQNSWFGGDGQLKSAKWYGVTGYLMRDLTDTIAGGIRAEWFRDQGNARIASIPLSVLAEPSNYAGFTLGFNWRPLDHVTIRPEARFDISDFDLQPPLAEIEGPYDDATDKTQVLYALDVILQY